MTFFLCKLRFLPASIVLFSLALVYSFVAPLAVSAQGPAATSEEILSTAHVANFAKVSPTLWRGAQPSDEALEKLAQGGIRTVIDLRMEGEGSTHEGQAASNLGLRYIHIPLGFMHPDQEKVLSFLRIVINPENQPVFVHCRQGADRTGTLCAIYHKLVDNWTFEQCWTEMRTHHFKPFLIALKKTVEEFSSADVRKLLAMPPLPQPSGQQVVAVNARSDKPTSAPLY